jgi:hypothetical protein
MMERDSQDWKLRPGRQRVSLTGVGEWPDGSSATVLVSNLSYEGCELFTDHPLFIGETIVLRLPNKGVIEAQARWVQGGRAGLRLLIGGNVLDARRARIGV